MTASSNKNDSQAQTETTKKAVEAFNKLDTDAKLAWFYFVYKKMGRCRAGRIRLSEKALNC